MKHFLTALDKEACTHVISVNPGHQSRVMKQQEKSSKDLSDEAGKSCGVLAD